MDENRFTRWTPPAAAHPHIPGARWVPIESIVKRDGWPPDELPPVDQLRGAATGRE